MKIAELQNLATELFGTYPAVQERFREFSRKMAGDSWFGFRELFDFMKYTGLEVGMTTDGNDYLYFIDNSRNPQILNCLLKENKGRTTDLNFTGDIAGFLRAGFYYMNILQTESNIQFRQP